MRCPSGSAPGQIFAAAPQNYVLPDVTVEKIDGEYQVILNGEQIPHLRISNTYKDIMSQDGNGSEVKDYIRDKNMNDLQDVVHDSPLARNLAHAATLVT